MAGAIIIASAIGVLMLVLVGYVLVGSTLSSGNSIASAQKDMALNKEAQMNTGIGITYAQQGGTSPNYWLNFDVQNTGNVAITDLDQVGVVVVPTGSNVPIYFEKGDGTGNTWALDNIYADTNYAPEVVNPGQWDPGEYLYCGIDSTAPFNANVMYVITAKGATDKRNVV